MSLGGDGGSRVLWDELKGLIAEDLIAGFDGLFPADPDFGEGPWIFGAEWEHVIGHEPDHSSSDHSSSDHSSSDEGPSGVRSPADPFVGFLQPTLAGMDNGIAATFRWAWLGVDQDSGSRPAEASPPTGRPVEVHGVTIAWLDDASGDVAFQRMVDWDGTLRQLGMVWSRAVRVDAPPEPSTS